MGASLFAAAPSSTTGMDLQAALPGILPRAIEWALARSREVQIHGARLTAYELALARAVGVARPELIRKATVRRLPLPEDAALREAASQTGLLGPEAVGLTLGYAVIVVSGNESTRLLSHEFRHVHQYEESGSIEAFLRVYLKQIVEVGYMDAPLERDARAHELAS
jgi:hypothetical protein